MGQRDYTAVKRTATAGIHLVFFLAMLTSIPVFIFRHSIGGLFTDSSEVVSMVSMTIIPFMIYQFGDGMQCNYANAMRGIAVVETIDMDSLRCLLYRFIAIGLSLWSGYELSAHWYLVCFSIWFNNSRITLLCLLSKGIETY